jgi:type I restriction enzyme M protein
MNADEFRDYILGFIFYKYLSEKIQRFADEQLESDGVKFVDLNENDDEGAEIIEAVKDEALDQLGYFLKPSELFHAVAAKGNHQSCGIERDVVGHWVWETANCTLNQLRVS